METKEEKEAVLFYEYEVYYNYDKLFNLKLYKEGNGILFDITYGDFFKISSSLEPKVKALFEKTEKGNLPLSMLSFSIYKTIVQPRYAPEKLFIFKIYDRIAIRTGLKLNYKNENNIKRRSEKNCG